MKHYLLVCWLIHCLSTYGGSIKDNGLLVIPVNVAQNSPIRLSEISDEVKKIELETSEDCLIGHIAQVLCDDDRIFVFDAQSSRLLIHVFDLGGAFSLCD